MPIRQSSLGVLLFSIVLLCYFILSDSGVRYSATLIYIVSRVALLFAILLLVSLLGILIGATLEKILQTTNK